MEPSIEMDTLNTGENIMKIEDKVEKNALMTEKCTRRIENYEKEIAKIKKRTTTIIIPMLGILILGMGLTLGVLSGYLLRLPHQQRNETGQVELSKPGTFTSKLYLPYHYMNVLLSYSLILSLIVS